MRSGGFSARAWTFARACRRRRTRRLPIHSLTVLLLVVTRVVVRKVSIDDLLDINPWRGLGCIPLSIVFVTLFRRRCRLRVVLSAAALA